MSELNSVEAAVKQRIFGLFSATKALQDLSRDADGRKVIRHPKCIEELELVRDTLSRILDKAEGK